MERDELRLELLKLVFRHDLHPEASVKVAKILETYVSGEAPKTASKKKDAENSILS